MCTQPVLSAFHQQKMRLQIFETQWISNLFGDFSTFRSISPIWKLKRASMTYIHLSFSTNILLKTFCFSYFNWSILFSLYYLCFYSDNFYPNWSKFFCDNTHNTSRHWMQAEGRCCTQMCHWAGCWIWEIILSKPPPAACADQVWGRLSDGQSRW